MFFYKVEPDNIQDKNNEEVKEGVGLGNEDKREEEEKEIWANWRIEKGKKIPVCHYCCWELHSIYRKCVICNKAFCSNCLTKIFRDSKKRAAKIFKKWTCFACKGKCTCFEYVPYYLPLF
jgi:hypothetical protein